MHAIFKQALSAIIPDSLLNRAYTIDELSQDSKSKVIKEYAAYSNQHGLRNSEKDILVGLREDNVLFDAYGNILQG